MHHCALFYQPINQSSANRQVKKESATIAAEIQSDLFYKNLLRLLFYHIIPVCQGGYCTKLNFQVLEKLGFDRKTLKRAAAHEFFVAYAAPFLLMTISSYFSVHALAKMMFTSLFTIW